MNKDNFYKKKLRNGLTVLFERREVPVVLSSVSVKFGSEYEVERIKGVSHFIEHLVFKGTKKRNVKQISAEVEKKGGILNAFTSEEVTCFWDKLPSKYLDIGIDIVSDLCLNPLFKEVDLENERKVILEEIKMYRDNPQFYVLHKIKELLYSKPFGLNISGTYDTMVKMKKEDVLGAYSNYSTENMFLTVVGKANFEDICEFGEKFFPKTKREIQEIPIAMRNAELIEKRKGIDQANFVFAYHVPKLVEKDRYSAEAIDVILTRGMSSRLFQEVREKRGLAYSIKGILGQDKNYGYELIYVGTVKEKVKEVKEIILREIKKLQKLESRDLEEAKEQLIGLRQVESEDSEQVMLELISEENSGNAEEYYKYEERINGIKISDVRKLSKLKSYSSISLVPD